MKDFLTLPALELAGMLAAGELTSLELTQACLDRIHAVDRRVGAFLFVDDDGALAAARRVDAERAAGRPLHRLAGVPVAIKDNMVSREVSSPAASMPASSSAGSVRKSFIIPPRGSAARGIARPPGRAPRPGPRPGRGWERPRRRA